ncbi:acetolactate synthase, large subunit [Pilibacter termitis]|uniref:Acetolactate synthase n=1 Tax=Pilibacter termitis TaxID=263852 RepID=A0A1T4RB81_9ENTE|nr:acetolactate synthase, large subunit [Pilibacter termitis]
MSIQRKIHPLNEKKNGSELLLDTLKSLGVNTVFGYPGGTVLPLYDALYSHSIQHILTRHEQGAVHAAEGFAKATGKAGVVIATSGPGAANTITGIADALSDSVPMLVITGQVNQFSIGKDGFQEADIIGITTPITKHNYQIGDARDIPRVVKEAYFLASTGRKGPVVIDLPKDVATEEVEEFFEVKIDTPTYESTKVGTPEEFSKILQAISQAKRPLVLAGGGVNYADATEELKLFVEKYQLPVVTTLLGLGAISHEHPLFLGMAGMHGSYAANMAITECDFLLNIGSRFDDRVASNPREFAKNAVVAHVDIDEVEIGKIIETDIPIVSDAKKALISLLALEQVEFEHGEWLEITATNKAIVPFEYDREQTREIKPQRVVELVEHLTDDDTIIVTDVGQHQMWVAQFYPFTRRQQLITSGGLGTMGFGIPAAIGAKIAHPDKKVILFVGDGGFQMTNQELAILNYYKVPITVILLNNRSLGMVRQWQECFYGNRKSESTFSKEEQPDFQKLAEAYRLNTYLIKKNECLESELKVALAKEVPTFIEVITSSTEHVLPMVPAGKANHEMLGIKGKE